MLWHKAPKAVKTVNYESKYFIVQTKVITESSDKTSQGACIIKNMANSLWKIDKFHNKLVSFLLSVTHALASTKTLVFKYVMFYSTGANFTKKIYGRK